MMATSRAAAIIICGLLYEAATVILTRSSADSTLRAWGVRLRERVGFKRAAVAVARKLGSLGGWPESALRPLARIARD